VKQAAAFLMATAMALALVTPGMADGEPPEVTSAEARQWEPIPLDPFGDSIKHAVARFEHHRPSYRQYTPEQIVHIAENLLAWQNPDGGWPKNKDWTREYSEEECARLAHRQRSREDESTLDNKNTWTQVDYLAQVYRQTGLPRYAASATRGLEYILDSQRSSGGWAGTDVEAITFNDGVMAGVLAVLQKVQEDPGLFAFIDAGTRLRIRKAYSRGLECLLHCQVRIDGRLTAWGQQHDHRTFEPIWARAFEPPALAVRESVGVVRFLMTIDHPPPEVVRAIESAAEWFDQVKIAGLRIDEVKTEPVRFPYRWSDFERVEVKDPGAPPLWARFYDLDTETPIFCTRDRVITSSFTDLSRERRTGYDWYGDWPAALLKVEVPVWRKKWHPMDRRTQNRKTPDQGGRFLDS